MRFLFNSAAIKSQESEIARAPQWERARARAWERERKAKQRRAIEKGICTASVQPLSLLGHISLLAHFFFLFVRFFFLPFFLLFHFTLLPIASYCVLSVCMYAFFFSVFVFLSLSLSLSLSRSVVFALKSISALQSRIAVWEWLICLWKLHLAFVTLFFLAVTNPIEMLLQKKPIRFKGWTSWRNSFVLLFNWIIIL